MSRCSSMVLTVNGRVGFVDEGRTFGSPATLMMSGAWPPPAPSVWKAWMVRPLNAATVSSTKPDSFSVSVWIMTCTSWSSATERQQSIAAGVVPQSSWSLSEQAPASTISTSPPGSEALPLPASPRLTGKESKARSIISMCQGPAVQVVAFVPSAGPVPPPSIVVTPAIRASSICCGQMKWMCESKPPGGQDLALAGDHLCARPDNDVDAGLDVGVAGLADPLDAAAFQPDVGLHDPPVIEDEGVGDDGVDGAVGVRRLRLPHAVADDLAAAELHLLAIGGEVALDLDHEVRVGKAQCVADGRPEHVGISGAREREGHGGEPQAVRGAKPGSRAASRSKVIVTRQPARELRTAIS